MIVVIDPTNFHLFQAELDGMFRLRKRIFCDQLGWDVKIQDGRERDEYDDLDPVYIVSLDERTREVRGSVRLMPTTGPHLMKDVFGPWFEEPIILESATIWEVTRFCVDTPWLRGHYTPRGLNLVTSELIVALSEVASNIGLTQLTALCHHGMVKALKRAKCPHEIIGISDVPSTGRVYLGLWDVSPEITAFLQSTTGLGALDKPIDTLEAA
jgi:N-acyl-L-homoserine lactone synthetase